MVAQWAFTPSVPVQSQGAPTSLRAPPEYENGAIQVRAGVSARGLARNQSTSGKI